MNTNITSGKGPVPFLGGFRNIHPAFTDQGRTHGNKKIRVRFQLATKDGADSWVKNVLETIESAKAGDGKASQILAVTSDSWKQHAGVSSEALDRLDKFLTSHRRYKKVANSEFTELMGWVDVDARVSDLRTDFKIDISDVEQKFDPRIHTFQRVGAFTLPAELDGWVYGIHLSRLPAAIPHFKILEAGHTYAGGFQGLTVLDTKKFYKGVTAGKVKVAVGFGPNTSRSIADQIVKAAMLGYRLISWSWGLRESGWTAADRKLVENAINYATAMGCTVGFASGDTGANDGGDLPNIDFGGSYTYSLCYGGTLRTGNTDKYWNEDPDQSAGGYGVSTNYKANYQGGGFRRGPDIASPPIRRQAFASVEAVRSRSSVALPTFRGQ